MKLLSFNRTNVFLNDVSALWQSFNTPCLHKWRMAPSTASQCGAEELTVDHVVLHCPIRQPSLEPMA